MSVPDAILKGMRETNELLCAKAIRSREMSALDHVYTPTRISCHPGLT
jgi:hypothetical protein